MNPIKIGKLLKELRKDKALTQEALAEMLGVSNRSVSRWENGTTMPDFSLLIELSKLYEISIDEILEGERNEATKKEDLIMEQETEKSLKKIAEYTRLEKMITILRGIRFAAWIMVACWCVIIGLHYFGFVGLELADHIESAMAGVICGISLAIAVGSTWKLRRDKRSEA